VAAMFVVRTRVGPSSIHGIGVFAAEPITAGREIWRFAPGLDLVIPLAQIPTLPAAFQAYLATYAYRSHDVADGMVLSCDHAKFLNHSDAPNTIISPLVTRASRDIAEGDEITCSYRDCCSEWDGFGSE
jgi:uncharacterized protein